VASLLYGSEFGKQQDCDELLHRLSTLLQDGLGAITGNPFQALRGSFQRHFVGATSEVHVRRAALGPATESPTLSAAAGQNGSNGNHAIGFPVSEGSATKQFLSVPVQRDNQTLTQALEEFTSWVAVGGEEVVMSQEHFRTVPPFLCFSSRQVSTLDWEESLDTTRFVVRSSPSLQRDKFERSKAVQQQCELTEALKQLKLVGESVEKANLWSGEQLKADVGTVAELSERLRLQLVASEKRVAELSKAIGDGGVEEPPVEEFLDGAVDANVVESVIRGLLGADTVHKLAELVFDGKEGGSDVLDGLVQGGTISREQAQAIVERLSGRRQARSAYRYDVHAVVVYQGTGLFGHYVAYIRQSDGAFLCFDDEQVAEHPGVREVRAAIAARGTEEYPAVVRMVVYRRHGVGDTDGEVAPLDLSAPTAAPLGAAANGDADGAKRRRTE